MIRGALSSAAVGGLLGALAASGGPHLPEHGNTPPSLGGSDRSGAAGPVGTEVSADIEALGATALAELRRWDGRLDELVWAPGDPRPCRALVCQVRQQWASGAERGLYPDLEVPELLASRVLWSETLYRQEGVDSTWIESSETVVSESASREVVIGTAPNHFSELSSVLFNQRYPAQGVLAFLQWAVGSISSGHPEVSGSEQEGRLCVWTLEGQHLAPWIGFSRPRVVARARLDSARRVRHLQFTGLDEGTSGQRLDVAVEWAAATARDQALPSRVTTIYSTGRAPARGVATSLAWTAVETADADYQLSPRCGIVFDNRVERKRGGYEVTSLASDGPHGPRIDVRNPDAFLRLMNDRLAASEPVSHESPRTSPRHASPSLPDNANRLSPRWRPWIAGSAGFVVGVLGWWAVRRTRTRRAIELS